MEKKKVGIMGGTFDPIHNAHLALAECARTTLSLDEVWFMPAGVPYFRKAQKKITDIRDREAMVRIAIQGKEGFVYSGFEAKEKTTTYTAETLKRLHEIFPKTHFYFMIGSDQLYSIEDWLNPEQIFALSTVTAGDRATAGRIRPFRDQVKYLSEKFNANVCGLDFQEMDISSTKIRALVREGKSIRALVPEAVADYIYIHKLYVDDD